MRLTNFQIKNYCSIIDSGVVDLSEYDNVLVLAGQNESGKSSVLKALRDFGRGKFDPDSMPFTTGDKPIQTVSCTYKVEEDDNIADSFLHALKDLKKRNFKEVAEEREIFDENKIKRIQKFTLTMSNENNTVTWSIDAPSSRVILQSSILEKTKSKQETGQENVSEEPEEKEKCIEINDEEEAKLFLRATPKIVFFDDFCTLLPDKIHISDLKQKKTNLVGYKAVKNLEQILETDFVEKDEEEDSVRSAKQEKENDSLSIDFQEGWKQEIHGESAVPADGTIIDQRILNDQRILDIGVFFKKHLQLVQHH